MTVSIEIISKWLCLHDATVLARTITDFDPWFIQTVQSDRQKFAVVRILTNPIPEGPLFSSEHGELIRFMKPERVRNIQAYFFSSCRRLYEEGRI